MPSILSDEAAGPAAAAPVGTATACPAAQPTKAAASRVPGRPPHRGSFGRVCGLLRLGLLGGRRLGGRCRFAAGLPGEAAFFAGGRGMAALKSQTSVLGMGDGLGWGTKRFIRDQWISVPSAKPVTNSVVGYQR